MNRARHGTAWAGALGCVTLLAVLSVPVMANDEDNITGPIAGFEAPAGAPATFHDVKSPLLSSSGWAYTTWAVHLAWEYPHYAGMVFRLTFDGHEISSLGLRESGPHTMMEVPGVHGALSGYTFPGSQSSEQVISPIAIWISASQAMGSGISLNTLSTPISLFHLSAHVKNSCAADNSDIDVTVTPFVIWHNYLSVTWQLGNSAWVYKTVSGTNWEMTPGAGYWFPASGLTFVPVSAFFAIGAPDDLRNVAGFGIEHIPEPASLLLLLGGAGAMVTGRLRRRRA
jgi:hypothetical protein